MSGSTSPGRCIFVDPGRQRLRLLDGGRIRLEAVVSTARNGLGERHGSGCTPRGWHRIRARIGSGLPIGAILRGRRPTGATIAELPPGASGDWISTRILWLGGREPGRNRFGVVDTMRRYIYIHGTGDLFHLGRPVSHGCIRMANRTIALLFDRVAAGDPVYIGDDAGDVERHWLAGRRDAP